MSWARVKGAYVLSRRNVSRIVAAISAAILAFHTATAALSPEDESLCRRASCAMCRVLSIEDSMPPGDTRVAVSDHVFCELADLFFRFKPLVSPIAASLPAAPPAAAPSPVRHYPTRKALTVPVAAAITGLSESTIKRLDKNPRNTNYPGRNSTPQILGAWAQLYRTNKFAAREVRAANRPRLGHGRG